MKLIKSPWLLASLLIIVMYWWMDRTSNKVCEIRMESQKEIYENYIDSCLYNGLPDSLASATSCTYQSGGGSGLQDYWFEEYGEEAWFEYDKRRKTLIPARIHRPEDTETEQLYDRLKH